MRTLQNRSQNRLTSRFMLRCVGVIAVTVVMLWIGYSLVARSLDRETRSQKSADAASAQLGAANDVLGYAVHIGSSPSGPIIAQLAAATKQAIQAWQDAHSAARSADARLLLSPAERDQLDELSGRTDATFADMLSAAQSLMATAASAEAGRGGDIPATVTRLAAKEGAHADAIKAEGVFFDAISSRAAVEARGEGWAFALIALGIIIIGIIAFITPVSRESARFRELSIRSEEQNARIGSEVARHVAERDFREAEAHFQALFRQSSIGVALTDEHGVILDSNEALRRMLGYGTSELRGTQFGVWAVDGPTASDRAAADGERVYRRKDGTTLWVDLSTTKAATGDGKTLAVIRMVQDIQERKKAEAQLHFNATHDGLTGLRNRKYFDEVIARAVDSVKRDSTRSFALFMIDLDRFKQINDTRGHAVGDALLVEVARRLAGWAASETTVARYGGDEFAAFLPNVCDASEAAKAAQRIHGMLGEPIMVGGLRLQLSTSIGICLWDFAFKDADAIMRAADGAAYRAKETGRARSVIYDFSMAMEDDLRRQVAAELRRAVDNNQFRLEYQPIVSLPDQRCLGFEALARWTHPVLGVIQPSLFIPVAEEIGLIGEIGAWVLRDACALLSKWRSACGPAGDAIKFNINVSSQQMTDPAFPALVRRILDEAGLARNSVVLELTETAMFDGRGPGSDSLAEIRRMGTPVVLDDFGTGYSSLSYLQRLSMDALKIDHSFVRGADGSIASPAIVHALITVAKSLGIDIVAEGVETQRQASSLTTMGCRLAQGYLFSHALDPEAAWDFLIRNSALKNMARRA